MLSSVFFLLLLLNYYCLWQHDGANHFNDVLLLLLLLAFSWLVIVIVSVVIVIVVDVVVVAIVFVFVFVCVFVFVAVRVYIYFGLNFLSHFSEKESGKKVGLGYSWHNSLLTQ